LRTLFASNNSPGHPAARPQGFAALLDLPGAHLAGRYKLALLRHREDLFPGSSVLLARSNGIQESVQQDSYVVKPYNQP